MQINLRWEKKFYSNSYSIYANNQQVGELKNNPFSQTVNGELNGKEYIFKTKGFFKQHTEIIDSSENMPIGKKSIIIG